MHQAGASTARGSFMQGSGMGESGGGALLSCGVRCWACSPAAGGIGHAARQQRGQKPTPTSPH
eukprot:136790-Prymnesium_polylepis.1